MTGNKSKAEKTVPQISDAEWRIMKVLWTKAPQTTNEVVDALDGETDWKPKTIHTLLSRLVQKGALTFEKQGREYLFQTAVTAEECEHEAANSFLDRFFDGDLAPFLARFVEGRKLKPAQIEKLKRILDGGAP
jgi:BlaI family penicillinase repressor